MPEDPCSCLELQNLLWKKLGLEEWPTARCAACTDAVLEAKNDLVRENAALRAELERLKEARG